MWEPLTIAAHEKLAIGGPRGSEDDSGELRAFLASLVWSLCVQLYLGLKSMSRPELQTGDVIEALERHLHLGHALPSVVTKHLPKTVIPTYPYYCTPHALPQLYMYMI